MYTNLPNRAERIPQLSFPAPGQRDAKPPEGIPSGGKFYLPATVSPSTRTVGEPKVPMPGVSRSFARAVMLFSRS